VYERTATSLVRMIEALAWGALAASSLVIGAALAFAHGWSKHQVGLVLAFGAGALISAVSFELAEEGIALGGAGVTGLGLGVGALTYFWLDGAIASRPAGPSSVTVNVHPGPPCLGVRTTSLLEGPDASQLFTRCVGGTPS
jgi:hypothetical protein